MQSVKQFLTLGGTQAFSRAKSFMKKVEWGGSVASKE